MEERDLKTQMLVLTDSVALWIAAHQASLSFTVSRRPDTGGGSFFFKDLPSSSLGSRCHPSFPYENGGLVTLVGKAEIRCQLCFIPESKLILLQNHISSCWVQFSSVAQSYLTICDPMDCSMPGFPVHHQLPELTQTHVHRDAIQPSHPLLSPSPAFTLSQHQGLFQ